MSDDSRDLYELAVLEAQLAGLDQNLAEMSAEQVRIGVHHLKDTYGDTPRVRATASAWFALWQEAHPGEELFPTDRNEGGAS